MTGPDKMVKFPLENYDKQCFLKNVIKNPNIIVGDYIYYNDFENVENFEKNVVRIMTLYHSTLEIQPGYRSRKGFQEIYQVSETT